MQEVTTRTSCRLCGSSNLSDIYSLGSLAVSTFIESQDYHPDMVPLDLILCKDCSLLQLRHSAPQELLYAKQYWYKSGINPVITNDLQEIVQVSLALVRVQSGDIFLDIGANDGTLLSFVPRQYFQRVGCEPAQNLTEELRKNADVVLADFWSKELYEQVWRRPAKVITAIGMFYDCEDPSKFIADVKAVLAPDGLFIAQMMTLSSMIDRNDVGNICHEHLEYYSYKALVHLFEKNGLEIYKVEKNGINGGSYRLFARHFTSGSISLPEPDPDYAGFVERIEANKAQTVAFIKEAVAQGKKVYGYGASTKAGTILQWYGLDKELITGIADRNPSKIGLFTVNGIPIVSEEEAREKADYFWVLPFAFTDYFIEREKTWREKGGQFILSTPEFKIV